MSNLDHSPSQVFLYELQRLFVPNKRLLAPNSWNFVRLRRYRIVLVTLPYAERSHMKADLRFRAKFKEYSTHCNGIVTANNSKCGKTIPIKDGVVLTDTSQPW